MEGQVDPLALTGADTDMLHVLGRHLIMYIHKLKTKLRGL
jgi:hypothetical protein